MCIRDRIWVATDKGLTFINEKTRSIINTNSFPDGVRSFLSGIKANSITQYEDNSMLAAGVGLNKINLERKGAQFSRPDAKDSIPLKDWVCNIIHKGQITHWYWIGTINSGLCKMSDPDYIGPSAGSVTQMPERITRYSWLTDVMKESVTALYEDRDGILWIGTTVGLVAYNTNENVSEVFLNDPNDANTLSNNSIKCIMEDSQGYLWVGTEAAGINRFDKKNKKFYRYTTNEGLCNNNVAGILEDKHYHLWISTRGGLSCLDPRTGTFKNYFYYDGLPSNEFNYYSFCRTSDGRLCYGSVDGVVVFNPDSIKNNPFAPRTVMTQIYQYNKPVGISEKVNGVKILTGPLNQTKKVRMSWHTKVFSFEFVGIHYASPEMLQYAYKLENFDQDWRYTGANNRMAHYLNLNPGKYVFKVKCANLDGVWGDETTLELEIIPPFWMTWWFRILMFVLLVLSIGAAFRGRIKQIERQKIRLQEQVDQQTLEIRQQADVLRDVNQALVQQQRELQETNVLLEERQEEIIAQKEEIEHQAEELKKANATKDKFFSIIGHDLKNPMYAMGSLAKMLKQDGREMGDEQLEEIYSMLELSSESVTALLENLLTWARSQSGRVEFKPESFDLTEVVNSTLQVLKMNAENKGLKLVSEVAKGTMVFADRNMLTTVIRNLIGNSIKFTTTGGITVKAEDFEGKKKISIVDTGIGMDEASRNKLFRIDVHHSTQGTSGEGGTGLGLIICKEFVEANKGKIWVESEVGKGSSFIFTLPVV